MERNFFQNSTDTLKSEYALFPFATFLWDMQCK